MKKARGYQTEAVETVLEDEETPYNTFDPNEEKQGIEGIDY